MLNEINEIIDTQDGMCIWQTERPLSDGRVHAFIRPVNQGVKRWAVIGGVAGAMLFDSRRMVDIMTKGRPDLTIVRVVSGKFP